MKNFQTKKIKFLALLVVLAIFPISSFAETAVFSQQGTVVEQTKWIAVTDASQNLKTLIETALGKPVNWQMVRAAEITCEDNDIRISFGADAVQGASPLGHILAVGASWRPTNPSQIMKAYIINRVNGSAGHIMVTLEF
jgi:hypothetical protein